MGIAAKRSPAPYPTRGSFGDLINWHLCEWGTYPGCSRVVPNPRMLISDFAKVIHEGVPESETMQNPERKLLYWRKSEHLPENEKVIKNIFKIFFKDDPNLEDWKSDLEKALNPTVIKINKDIELSNNARTSSHRYLSFISQFKTSKPILPITHTCYGTSVSNILDSKKVFPVKHDEYIGKSLSFFYYGLPKYRDNLSTFVGLSPRSALFSFIFDYANLGTSVGILPFNSTNSSLYKNYIGVDELDDFYIPNRFENPGKFVSAFFGDNDKYLRAKIRDGIFDEISPFDFHSRSFCDVYTASIEKAEDFSELLEIHYSDPITVSRTNLLAIIAPESCCEDEQFLSFAEEMDATLLQYNFDPISWVESKKKIEHVATKWLTQRGIIGE